MDDFTKALATHILATPDSPQGPLTFATEAAYHASPGLGGSGLKSALRSGPHWLAKRIARAMDDSKDDAGRRFGNAVHCLVLEPETWKERYAPPFLVGSVDASLKLYESGKEVADQLKNLKALGMRGGGDRALKVSGSNAEKMAELQRVEPFARYTSDIAADYYREQGGRTILQEDEEARARAAAAAVAEWHDRWVAAGNRPILGGRTEQAIGWTDPETGIYCRGAVDIIAPAEWAWVDLKTVGTADYGFVAQARSHEYGLQADHYLDAHRTLVGGVTPRWGWLCVEDQAPHGVRLHWASEDFLARAHRQRRLCLERILDVLTNPAPEVYPVEAGLIDLTAWERREEEDNE